MKVRNVSGVARWVPALNREVAADDAIEVDKDLGRSLCDQPDNWQAVKASKTDKEGDG